MAVNVRRNDLETIQGVETTLQGCRRMTIAPTRVDVFKSINALRAAYGHFRWVLARSTPAYAGAPGFLGVALEALWLLVRRPPRRVSKAAAEG